MTRAYSELLESACQWLIEEGEKNPFFYLSHSKTTKIKAHKVPEIQKTTYSFPPELDAIEILLLDYQSSASEQELLKRMAKAIDERIAPASYYCLKELGKDYLKALTTQGKKVRWILFSEPKLYLSTELVAHYQTNPQRSLFGKPLFFLTELSAYNQDPSLKKNLWSTLLQTL